MHKENYDAQKGVPSLITPLVMFDNKEFMLWMGTFECKIWHRMYRHIVRAAMQAKIHNKIFKEYYSKGILSMYKKHKEIAYFFGHKEKSRTSKAIRSLIEKKIVITHPDRWEGRNINVYELGTHDMSVSKHETLHLYTYFNKENALNIINNL